MAEKPTNYQVILTKSVQKQLDGLTADVVARVLQDLAELQTMPRPSGVKKLKGRDAWRIRVGNYRIVYEIDDRNRRIVILIVGHRREVYR